MIVEHDPWLFVIGADTPTFALYADRTVIYAKDMDAITAVSGTGIHRYRTVRLSEREYTALLQQLVPDNRYYALKDEYVLVIRDR